jgi:hypothetical protein
VYAGSLKFTVQILYGSSAEAYIGVGAIVNVVFPSFLGRYTFTTTVKPPTSSQTTPNICLPTETLATEGTRATTDCVNCQNNYCSTLNQSTTTYPPPVCDCAPDAYYITPTQFDMRRKAEIFLYKKNANDQTKKQKYALLAKGINIYKKISWATQSEYYTNPNVNGLPQVGYTLTCGDVNILQNCSPSTNNDVPGPIINICNNREIPLTNYVTRRIYTSNGTKWPQTAWKPGNNGFPVGKAGRFLM